MYQARLVVSERISSWNILSSDLYWAKCWNSRHTSKQWT